MNEPPNFNRRRNNNIKHRNPFSEFLGIPGMTKNLFAPKPETSLMDNNQPIMGRITKNKE